MDHSKKDEEQDMTMAIIYINVGVILLLAILAGSIAYYLRVYKANKIKKAIMDFIKENRLINKKEAKERHTEELAKMSGIVKAGRQKTREHIPRNKRRKLSMPLNPDTRVIVKDEKDPYHATRIVTRSKIVYVAAESPIKKKDEKKKLGSCDDFWNMIMDQESEFIVSCSAVSEMSSANYYSYKVNEVKEFERFKVTTKTETPFIKDKVTCRELEVQDKTGVYPTRTIKHFHFLEWYSVSILKEHEPVFEVLNVVNTSTKPVIVHDSLGCESTMIFIGIQYVYEEVLFNPKVKFWDVIRELCDIRWGSFGQKDEETMYLLTGVFYLLIKKFKLQMTPYTEDFAILMSCRKAIKREKDDKYKKKFAEVQKATGGQAFAFLEDNEYKEFKSEETFEE